MKVWRLCSRRHHVPDGEGARLSGGRWNLPGTAVVYTSASLSLAVLETLVHVDSDLLPQDLVILSADIPDRLNIDALNEKDLPPNRTSYPPPEATQSLGSAWVRQAQTAVLSVPSVLIRHERNFLLNPSHNEYGKIVWSRPSPFAWDPRLAKHGLRRRPHLKTLHNSLHLHLNCTHITDTMRLNCVIDNTRFLREVGVRSP